jgi:tRNA (guanine26-N2/guanine27-N2)-dimethyltransferase
MNVPGAPFTHELALRILLHSIQSTAAKYKRCIEPLMSCSIDYYVRVFVRVWSDVKVVKQCSVKSSFLTFCQGCKLFQVQHFGKIVKEGILFRHRNHMNRAK